MFSLRSPNMDGPYALTYPHRRRTLLSSPSCISDFPRFPSLPPPFSLPLPPSPPPRSNLPSRSYHYPISLPWTIPPSIPPVNPDTLGLGLGLSFNGDSNLQARLWALEQQDDPALLQLQHDDYDSDSDSDYDYDDYDEEVQDEDDDDHWRSRFGRRMRKLLALRGRVHFVWRKLSL